MRIKNLKLHDFRGFSELDLNFNPKLNVVVGVNGSGKSSIIDALAILLSRFFCRIAQKPRAGRDFDVLDIKNGKSFVSGTVSVEYAETELAWTVSKKRGPTKKEKSNQIITNLRALNKLIEQVHDVFFDADSDSCNLPIAVLYGTNRLVKDIPLRIRTQHDFSHQFSAIDESFFGTKIDFRLFFEWFRSQEDIENQEIRKKGSKYRDRNLTAVRTAVGELVGVSDITINRNPLRMDVRKGKFVFDIRQMSDGEKCFIAMVGDLARRLAMANPGPGKPLEGRAVVLIDEIELHLHPAWQRNIVSGLQNIFPNCQFIVSTHSPQVIGECPRESIILLKSDGTGNTVIGNPPRSFGMDSNLVLESLMNAPSRNSGVAKKIDAIYRLIDKEDAAGAKRKIQELRAQLGDLPDLAGAEAAMAWLED